MSSKIRQLFPSSGVLHDKDGENALVERCQQGDRKAMDELVRNYERPVYNAALALLGNRDDAADITQTTFLKAFGNLDRFNPRYRFFSWIYRIAVNESINALRRRLHSTPLPDHTADAGPGPAEAAVQSEASRALRTAMMDLSDDYRSVIVLRYFAGASYDQMAQILDIPEKRVKSRLFSARQKMKQALESHGVISA